MNRTNLIAAGALVLGVLACNRSRIDDNRVGDASTTGATMTTPENDRSGGVGTSSSPGMMSGRDGGHVGTMGKDTSEPREPRGSNRMTDTGSATDRDRNMGITRDGGSVSPTPSEPIEREPIQREPSPGGTDYGR